MEDRSEIRGLASGPAGATDGPGETAAVADPGPAEDKGADERAAGSLGDLAKARFMEALFERKIDPGAFLSQGDLVRLLGVPVGPLRDALRVLQTEGWLTIHARSGIEIRKPDFALVRNSYQLRLVLERAAVRSFAELAPLAEMEAMEARHRHVIEAVSGHEMTLAGARDLEEVDFGFHMQVIKILDNPMIDQAYRQAQGFVQLTRLDRAFRLSWPLVVRTMTEHLDIIAAFRRRDAAAAEAALELHFARAMQRAIGFF
jgi:DNA-binding GntR family transcriptional regulator